MKTHLEEHEFTAAVAGFDLEPEAAEHLGSCLSCRQQVSSMQDAIEARRLEFEADQPDWERQHQEIMMRVPAEAAVRPARQSVWKRPLLAVAAVLVAAVGLKVMWAPAPPVDSGVVPELPVEQILAEVDAVLADDTIPGFELIDPGLDEEFYENGAS